MTTTINLAKTEPVNSVATAQTSITKPGTERLDSKTTEDSTVSEDSFLSSLEKLTDENGESADGNVFPTTGKLAENTAEDDRSELLPSLNLPVFTQNTNKENAIFYAVTGEQSLVLDNKINEAGIKLASDAGLLSSLSHKLMQVEEKAQGQAQATQISTSVTTDGLVTRHTESSLLNYDSTALSNQKNSISGSLLAGQLPAMTTQQTLSMIDNQSALLQQSSSLAAENSSSSLSALLNISSGTVNSSSMITMPQLSIGERFGQPAWAQGMAKQIVWMTSQNINSAEIRLNPAHLGPIEVRIDMKDELINVALNSRHAVVREAMEMSLPRLREMLDSNGMNLADTDISHQSFAEQREENTANGQANIGNSVTDDSNITSPDKVVINQSIISSAMVDYYI